MNIKQNIVKLQMSASPRGAPSPPTSRPKLSISTLYPIELPKLKFYTETPIHEDPSADRHSLRQVPVTFVRYLRNKQKRRLNSRTQLTLPPTLHESMLITNCREPAAEREEVAIQTRTEAENARFATLLQKVGNAAKERDERSRMQLNCYKKKFLKYKCRKSIDLDAYRLEAVRKLPNKDCLLADGLKIEKIQFSETPKLGRQLINRAKFNTLSCEEPRRGKHWQIGPWCLGEGEL